MQDIQSRNDIITLVDRFYEKVLVDDVIGIFFTQVVKLDWDKHMPVMYDFWESTLLDAATYKGNPMLKHIALNQKMPLKKEHFERWLALWEETVQENFLGAKAEEAVNKAQQIAGLMQYKVGGKMLL